MQEITPENATEYLWQQGWLPRGTKADVQPLAWGVSNVVMRVVPESGTDFVLKQSREKLRTAAPWFSRLDRIYREIDVLNELSRLLPSGVVPEVLHEDRQNYLFAMQAAPAEHVVWKERLLGGEVDYGIARQLGNLLARVHRQTAYRADLRERFGDREVFHQLRVHPFYETLAEKFPDAATSLQQLILETQQTAVCLVLADFSPKNVLLTGSDFGSGSGIILVDFETGHYGDPAFDLGFFLSHLLLKTVRQPAATFGPFAQMTTEFLDRYWAELDADRLGGALARPDLLRRTWGHLAGCLWARIDGTSPIDYLPEAEQQDVVRTLSRSLFREPPDDWPELLARLQQLHSAASSMRSPR